MYIAKVNLTRYTPGTNRVAFKLVKGQEVKTSIIKKLSDNDRIKFVDKVDRRNGIERRIEGRRAQLNDMGYDSDVNLVVLEFMTHRYTNRQLLDMRSGQNGVVRHYTNLVLAKFDLADRFFTVDNLTDDGKEGIEATVWAAWPVSTQEAAAIASFLNTLP